MDVAHAVQQNAYWSRQLGWSPHYSRIATLFPVAPANAVEFAHAVAQWQRFHRPPLEADGIIDPRTWYAMQQDLGMPAVPMSPPPALPLHYVLSVRGYTVNFWVFILAAGSEQKVRQLGRFFSRLPDAHLAVLWPIYVIADRPRGGSGGGTWRAGDEVARFLGKQRVTGVPDDYIRTLIRAERGVMGIPRDRWRRGVSQGAHPLEFTVIHEVGHCVDYQMDLTARGATERDFAGIEPICGGVGVTRRAVEAYARYICKDSDPAMINDPVLLGESPAQAATRVIAKLRSPPAFRSVPDTWRPR